MTIIENLTNRLIEEEGMKLKPYRCPAGKLTIGVGRNLDDVGICKDEALQLLKNDIIGVLMQLRNSVKGFDEFPDAAQEVLVDMLFNMGAPTFFKFKKMLTAIENWDFQQASKELLNSVYAKQVPNRANRNSQLLLSIKRMH